MRHPFIAQVERDGHPAHRVEGECTSCGRTVSPEPVDRHRQADVLQQGRRQRVEPDARRRPSTAPSGVADQHRPRLRDAADSHQRNPRLSADVVGNPQPEGDRRCRVGDNDHYPVAERLGLSGTVSAQQSSGLSGERQLGRRVIAVRFTQRGEPGKVCEQEGARRRGPARAADRCGSRGQQPLVPVRR